MNKIELAYIAGILDGEGFITIDHSRKENKYRVCVGVGNTAKILLDWLQACFGGGIVKSRKPEGYRDFYQWRLFHGVACEFLLQVIPYLKLKRGQAELAIRFQEQKYNPQTGKRKGRPRTSDELAYEEACHILLHSMNRTGKNSSNGNPVPSLSKGSRVDRKVERLGVRSPINKPHQIPPSLVDEDIVQPFEKSEE